MRRGICRQDDVFHVENNKLRPAAACEKGDRPTMIASDSTGRSALLFVLIVLDTRLLEYI